MSIDIEALGITQLSTLERLELIERIWDSLPEQVNADEVPDWHLTELAKRRAAIHDSPREGKPWREVLAKLRSES